MIDVANARPFGVVQGIMSRLPIHDVLGRDLRQAFRLLGRTPGFTVTAILTLALAIGANAAVFSLANAILLRPLPYPEPDRLAYVGIKVQSSTNPRKTSARTARRGSRFETTRPSWMLPCTAAASAAGINLVVGQSAVIVSQQRVSAGYFNVLGVHPFLGREFTADEDRAGGEAAVVLSYGLWRRAFNSDLSIANTRILLRGEPYTVVGVMPETFTNITPVDVWTPVRASTTGEGSGTNFEIIARPKAGVSWMQANAELATISAAATTTRFGSEGLKNATATLELRPMQGGAR